MSETPDRMTTDPGMWLLRTAASKSDMTLLGVAAFLALAAAAALTLGMAMRRRGVSAVWRRTSLLTGYLAAAMAVLMLLWSTVYAGE